jgi:hypothetical protein
LHVYADVFEGTIGGIVVANAQFVKASHECIHGFMGA